MLASYLKPFPCQMKHLETYAYVSHGRIWTNKTLDRGCEGVYKYALMSGNAVKKEKENIKKKSNLQSLSVQTQFAFALLLLPKE